ncbi:dimethyladenosine transferase, partial [Xanthomonas citri pv. citri]|nr:dimethyladenosine transferase [Xanthomonas citri pv. citri]
DGSGTVRPKVSGPHRLAVGDRFRVAMRKYGVPYTMPLTATAVDEDELVEWAHPGGHRWRWAFRDNGDGTTEVTETFDYSWARPAVRRAYE